MIKKIGLPVENSRGAAMLRANSANEESRTVEMIWTQGARGVREDWTGERYFEELGLEEGNIRLREKIALIDNHVSRDTDRHLGVVTALRIVNGEGIATANFDSHPLAKQRFESASKGFLTDVSVGYRVYRYAHVGSDVDPFDGDSVIPIYRAVDWEPLEISLVPIGFDSGAKFRSESMDNNATYSVIIDDEKSRNENGVENVPAPVINHEEGEEMPPEVTEDVKVNTEEVVREAQQNERTRVSEILEKCSALKQELLANDFISRGMSIEEVNSELIKVISKDNFRSEAPAVSVGKEDIEKRTEGLESALLHRANPKFVLTENARRFRGYSLVDIAREMCHDQSGNSIKIVERAFQTSSAFKNILSNVANKTLLEAFTSTQRTFEPFVRKTTVSDFKTGLRARLTDLSGLKKIPELGEFENTIVSDRGETVKVETYGRKFGLSRQAIINDDLSAFDRLPTMIGRKAATLESKLVYDLIKANGNMSDGNALFSAAHGNLPTGAALSSSSLSAAIKAFRAQTTEDGEEFIDVSPKFLVVCPALEETALKLVASIIPNQSSSVNIYSGRFQVIVEPRLSAAAGGSDTAWYLMAAPSDIDTLELINLSGFEGIQIEEMESEDVLGVTWRAFYDVGVAAIEWRGMLKNVGG